MEKDVETSSRKLLKTEIRRNALSIPGGSLSKESRLSSGYEFVHFQNENGFVYGQLKSVKLKHIVPYIEWLRQKGNSARTIQNKVSHLRQILRVAGREQFVDEQLTSEKLAIEKASRRGTKKPITDELYADVFERASKHHPRIAAGLALSRHLGLRGQEVVRSSDSLERWHRIMVDSRDDANPVQRLEVVFGTKGARPRSLPLAYLPDRGAAAQAITNALQICRENNGRLIPGENLKSAVDRWDNSTRRLGLTGEYAAHSLRYRFAVDTLSSLVKNGLPLNSALSVVSMLLGHGDGRGRWIKQVYCQSLDFDALRDAE